jgi:hypothetical protein
MYRRIGLSLLFSLLSLPTLASAQAAAPASSSQPATQAQIAALQQTIQNAQTSGDNAWMLVSSALVLLMTGPGLALFYGGLVRKKNILGTMMQSFAMMGLVTILWAIVGYSLAFGHGSSFIGGFDHMFLRGVGLAPSAYARTIPEQTYMIYQLMFAIITPALITGAFAERMKFSSMAVFLSLWSLVVYCPMAHMVWGISGLLNANGGRFPSLDFAGGTVVHVTSGVSALVTALYIGKRAVYRKTSMPPPSMVLCFIGAALWVDGSAQRAAPSVRELSTSAFATLTLPPRPRPWADGGGMDSQRQAYGAGRNLGCGCGTGGHHAGVRLRPTHVSPRDRPPGRNVLFLNGLQGQSLVRIRRFSGCFRRARRGGHPRGAADRRLCGESYQPSFRDNICGHSCPDGRDRRALGTVGKPRGRRGNRLGNLSGGIAGAAFRR